ncbi:MAG TPA: type 4a pilus biogenesis protein PilO [Pseudobdellovibrionaceae bacterium]|nr:type 4a pilus biogenesis protein PilO [Pseudobdellovibrionaceae bacterium]
MNKVFAKLNLYSMVQILSFSVVLSMIFYFTMYDDGHQVRSEIAALSQQVSEESAKKAETEKVLAEEARMKESVVLLSQQYQELSRRIPTALTSIELNRNIDAFARNAGVNIKSRKPLETTKGQIVEEVPIEVSLEGSFAELAQFVYVVASSERVTALRSFSFLPIEKSTRLKFEGVVVGYQIAPEPPTGPEGGVPR